MTTATKINYLAHMTVDAVDGGFRMPVLSDQNEVIGLHWSHLTSPEKVFIALVAAIEKAFETYGPFVFSLSFGSEITLIIED